MYQLHPQLAADTFTIGQSELCDVLLMNDARYPWVILVPRRADVIESFQLPQIEQEQLMSESAFVAEHLANLVNADKMNVAALGNVVSQLHIHHVARFASDEAWPSPVWGKGNAVQYQPEEAQAVCEQLRQTLAPILHNGH